MMRLELQTLSHSPFEIGMIFKIGMTISHRDKMPER
jgi:hypothetical protein